MSLESLSLQMARNAGKARRMFPGLSADARRAYAKMQTILQRTSGDHTPSFVVGSTGLMFKVLEKTNKERDEIRRAQFRKTKIQNG